MTKKILIYGDTPGWAYDSIINFVRENFGNEYEIYFDYIYCHRYLYNELDLFSRVSRDLKNFIKFIYRFIRGKRSSLTFLTFFRHRIFFFWQGKFYKDGRMWRRKVLPFWLKYDAVILLDYYFDRVAKLSFKTDKLIKGIYFSGFPPQGCEFDFKIKTNPANIKSVEFFCKEYLSDIDALLVGAPSIGDFYAPYVSNIYFCNAIQKEYLFYEKEHQLKSSKDVLAVGWTGNPNRGFKNFYSIIVPVVDRLKNKGLRIELKTRFSGPYETLPEFYKKVDLVLIASEQDAGPAMFAEASLMGIPSISSKVGYPLAVISHMKNGILVDNISLEEYERYIELLYNNRQLLLDMSKSIRAGYLNNIGSVVMAKRWRAMFSSVDL